MVTVTLTDPHAALVRALIDREFTTLTEPLTLEERRLLAEARRALAPDRVAVPGR